MAAVPVVVVIPPIAMERIVIVVAITPITTNVTGVIEPVAVTPFAGPVPIIAVTITIACPGVLAPPLIVPIAIPTIAAAREVTISITTIPITTIEIAVAVPGQIAVTVAIRITSTVKIARAVEIACAFASIAASLIKPPRYVSTTRRITIAAD
jgi:hypothetical protein